MKFLGTKLFIALSFVLFFPKNLISNPLTYNQQVLKTLQKSPHFFPDSHAIGNLKPVDISTKNGKTLLILASGFSRTSNGGDGCSF